MDFDDDIFDSFFACIGAVKEAKVFSIKLVTSRTNLSFQKNGWPLIPLSIANRKRLAMI